MAIRLVPHDPHWADIYEMAATDIRSALGSTALSVDHVGDRNTRKSSRSP
jgi:GrpB-like predicted nucleotidyltransferase (UPF0157 family)